jgi:hypothetical protein
MSGDSRGSCAGCNYRGMRTIGEMGIAQRSCSEDCYVNGEFAKECWSRARALCSGFVADGMDGYLRETHEQA